MYAANNGLVSLPSTISGLQAMTCLDLSHNKLTGLPSALSLLVALKVELVARCEVFITNCPSTPYTFQQEIDLSFNRFTQFPDPNCLTNLANLHIAHNRMKTLPEVLNTQRMNKP